VAHASYKVGLFVTRRQQRSSFRDLSDSLKVTRQVRIHSVKSILRNTLTLVIDL